MPRRRGGESRGVDERALLRQRRAREIGTLALGRPASVLMAYPSPYRAGMSSLGFQTLYRQLNEAGIAAHRAFLPDAWEPLALPWPQPRVSILSVEAERPISDYPIVAISVAYELEVVGLVRLLEGAGIPLRSSERGRRDPLVVIGGPLCGTNPSVLLSIADVLIFGEGEELLPKTIEIASACRDRAASLEALVGLPHALVAGEDGIDPLSEFPEPAKVGSEHLPAHSAIVTPDAELADMFLIEPERGCSRRCTFCVMRGPTTGGMRLLDADETLQRIPDHAKKVGLVGAAVTDHPQLESLVARIVESGRGLGISSLRADRLTPELVRNLGAGGYRTITVASDGISARMRKVLARRVEEQHLIDAARLVKQEGLHKLKVYEMIGAPTETDDDVEELIRFAHELTDIARIAMTFSTFVAKRNTPMDGQPFVGVKTAEARLDKIRRALRGRVDIRPQPPKWAWVEYELAQRGPEVAEAAIAAVHAGGRFADWKRALAECAPNRRALVFGDERARARRRGKARDRPRLPLL
jgi:radical SAM superfamily enzyme YgiQ (UPF0313 family)